MGWTFKHTLALIVVSRVLTTAFGQDSTSFVEKLSVVGKPGHDSIVLRWAPTELPVWLVGNKNGYVIEKFVMARNGSSLDPPEKLTLTSEPLRPLPEAGWESLVNKNNYAAVAAQALYGNRFELDLTSSDIFQIVNKVQENEQRFSFALFCADMSGEVAEALGLVYVDRKIKSGEKYLYRISIDQVADSLRGSIFISPDDPYRLLPPLNVRAKFDGHVVSLQWDKLQSPVYTAYIVERSIDGKYFSVVSQAPLLTVSQSALETTRHEYAMDSIADLGKTYYYRVIGLTPFGEQGPASKIASGKGSINITEVPHIISFENIQNHSIQIMWDFPPELDQAISGFSVERSTAPRGVYHLISQGISGQIRRFEDSSPENVNYYRVTAHALNGKAFRSPVYLAQLIDSVPPAPPVGLKATVNDYGHLELSWQSNQEKDHFGYRIYKANTDKEELFQLTFEPIRNEAYTDTVNLNALNECAYYQVMALDKNQNHSELSEKLQVILPDKIKPQPPVFLPVRSGDNGVVLRWLPSSSQDVVQYDIYRQRGEEKQWLRIKVVQALQDSIYSFVDLESTADIPGIYTIVAVDDSGLESSPCTPVNGKKIDNQLRPPVQWGLPVINKENNTAVLSWQYDYPGVSVYRIYKANGRSAGVLYRSVKGDKFEFSDKIVPGEKYTYNIVAVYQSGEMSKLSEILVLNY